MHCVGLAQHVALSIADVNEKEGLISYGVILWQMGLKKVVYCTAKWHTGRVFIRC